MKATLPSIFDHFLADMGESCSPGACGGSYSPAVEVRKNDSEYQVIAWLPGVNKEDLNITVENGNLILSGKFYKREEAEGENALKTVYSELASADDFSRTLRIKEGHFDVENVNANLENGVLTVTLPVAEAVKPRKIEIKAN